MSPGRARLLQGAPLEECLDLIPCGQDVKVKLSHKCDVESHDTAALSFPQLSSGARVDVLLVVGLLSCFSQWFRHLVWLRCLSSRRV